MNTILILMLALLGWPLAGKASHGAPLTLAEVLNSSMQAFPGLLAAEQR